MQRKAENPVDARSFPEIWKSLNKDEQDDLANSFYQNKLCLARQTVFYWGNGERTPRAPVVRDTIAKLVGKAIGAKVMPATLFPSR